MRNSPYASSTRAVSPVLGVVLLVGITVLLSAAIAGIVLGVGAEPDLPPQVDWSFTYDGEGNLTIRHDGGDPIDPTTVRVVGGAVDPERPLAELHDGTWTVGTSATIELTPTEDDRDVLLVSREADGSGHVLATFELPEG